MDFGELVDRVDGLLAASSSRVLLGIAGPPGAGKTTLAQALVGEVNERLAPAVHVPMDGFHLADSELRRLGRTARKGAPDTFDAAGYRTLLMRLRIDPDTVWAPAFDRDIEQPIAGSIPVSPDVRLVVSEGNYLLLDTPPWRGLAGAFDEVWYCAPDDGLRLDLLVARHIAFGKTPDHAREWANGTDERNARLVAATVTRADLVIDGYLSLPNS